jgi:hypothetical protein
MSSPFAKTYASVEEVIKLYPHLPRESIMLTHTTVDGLPQIDSAPIKKNRKLVKRTQFNISPYKLPPIK